jgi:hypothetical protein
MVSSENVATCCWLFQRLIDDSFPCFARRYLLSVSSSLRNGRTFQLGRFYSTSVRAWGGPMDPRAAFQKRAS